jgi:replicative DNA helicase
VDNVRHLNTADEWREPPRAHTAEQIVLAIVLDRPDVFERAAQLLTVADFADLRHANLWQHLVRLRITDVPLGFASVGHELIRTGDIGSIGGAPYLHDIQQRIHGPAELDYWATQVREATQARRIAQAGMRLVQMSQQPDRTDIPGLLASVRAELDETALDVATAAPKADPRLVDGASFILDIPDQTPAIWGHGDDILSAEGEYLLIAGPSGVGKTTIAQQMLLAAIGIRKDALGFPVRPCTRALYLASDRPPQAARSLRRMVSPEDRDALAERLVVWKGPPPADLAKDPDALRRLCAQAGADFVVLDSLKDMAGELSKDEVGGAVNKALQLALVEGVEVTALHHHRKKGAGDAGKEATSLDELYGSTWITAGAGSVVGVWGAPGDPIVSFRHLKQPAAEVGPFRLRHDHARGETEIFHQVDALELMAHMGPAGLSAVELSAQMFPPASAAGPSQSEREKARRKLELLVDAGLAERLGGGKGRGKETRYRALFNPSTGEVAP